LTVGDGSATAVLANVGTDDARPLSVNIPSELWLAMGISTTSMVASPAVLSRKSRRVARKGESEDSGWTDIFRG
jgi:hypothetical protein